VLSSHELAQGYEDVTTNSIYVTFPLDDGSGRELLVWTTTPWTLISNVAVAVHPDLEYGEYEVGGRRLILATARAELPSSSEKGAPSFAELGVRRTFSGRQLVGLSYRRPLDVVPLPDDRASRVVVPGEFVTAEDGSGLVHMAPAFGADDYVAGQKHGLPMLRPVDDAGRFMEDLPLVAGLFVKEADPVLVEDLRKRDLVFRYSLELHSYPHCWRCGSPLIYMARDSWYIRTTQMKDVMIGNNNRVQWHPPEVGTGRFGEWLEGNVDWALSRERYWGTPLPIWLCDANADHREFIGSFEQLAQRAGPLGDAFDPHKPYIDELTWSCRDCGSTMRRTPEVIDVWFDSGSMPYAQWHYPFENEAQWRRHFPADFICEGVDQTRGWFYSMMAISSMLGHGSSYRHVLVNDLVLDVDGQKMSKSKGNVVDPWTAIERFGVDAIRWYFMTNSQPWVPKRFDPDALSEAAHRIADTLANTYKFFALYANLEGWTAGGRERAQPGLLDRWILSRLATVSVFVNESFANYDITPAARAIGEFVVADVSNWYVRRSRERFWGSAENEDTQAAFDTLHEVLATVARLLAPIMPFQSDWLHRALGLGSVHLAPFPSGADLGRDDRLEQGMDAIRTLARLGRAARERMKVRVRQPLRTLQAFSPVHDISDELVAVLKDELNVKEVHFLQRSEELVALRAHPNFRVLGKRFGGQTQAAAAAVRDLDNAALRGFREGGPLRINVNGETFDLTVEEVEVREEPRGELVVESDAGFTIALDPQVDESLRKEGMAREIVSRIQRLRRDSGLEVSDRIRLTMVATEEALAAIEAYREYIAHETLAEELIIVSTAPEDDEKLKDVELDGMRVRIAVERL
jgi:isoleucyl-tRNA synthetase